MTTISLPAMAIWSVDQHLAELDVHHLAWENVLGEVALYTLGPYAISARPLSPDIRERLPLDRNERLVELWESAEAQVREHDLQLTYPGLPILDADRRPVLRLDGRHDTAVDALLACAVSAACPGATWTLVHIQGSLNNPNSPTIALFDGRYGTVADRNLLALIAPTMRNF